MRPKEKVRQNLLRRIPITRFCEQPKDALTVTLTQDDTLIVQDSTFATAIHLRTNDDLAEARVLAEALEDTHPDQAAKIIRYLAEVAGVEPAWFEEEDVTCKSEYGA
jgi:hypothetical protein